MTPHLQFEPRGRRIPWFAAILGLLLVADGVLSATAQHLGPALVVGAIGLERLLHAVAWYWNSRRWPWRIRNVRLTARGLEFDETHAYGGADRETLLPGGLILKADVEPGTDREMDGGWVAVLYTILGTIVWSEHSDESAAREVADKLDAVLDTRGEVELEPPRTTGALDLIGERRAVMWGRAPVIPVVVVARGVLLLGAIFVLPALVVGESLTMLMWALVALTVALLTFPFVGAVATLGRRGRLIATGASVQEGELRAWEQSTPTHAVRLRNLRHVGFAALQPSGDPLLMRLVAHTDEGDHVESYVDSNWFVQLAAEAYRLVAESYDVDGPTLERTRWSVRLPGGVAEAIEAVSFMQRFVAEARADDG